MESRPLHQFEEDLKRRLVECQSGLDGTIARIADPLQLESILDHEIRYQIEELNRHFHAYLASLLVNEAEEQVEQMPAAVRCIYYDGDFESQSIGEVEIPAWIGWRAKTMRATRLIASATAACCIVSATVWAVASRAEPPEPVNKESAPQVEFPFFGFSSLALGAAASATLAGRPRLLSFLTSKDKADARHEVARYLDAFRKRWMTAARSAEGRFREHLVRLSAENHQDESPS
jgi:hypothetical protein